MPRSHLAMQCCGLSECPEVRCGREMLCGTQEQESSQGAKAGILRGPLKCLVMLELESLHLSIECSTRTANGLSMLRGRPTQLHTLVTPSRGPDHTNQWLRALDPSHPTLMAMGGCLINTLQIGAVAAGLPRRLRHLDLQFGRSFFADCLAVSRGKYFSLWRGCLAVCVRGK